MHPKAGKPAEPEMLVDVDALVAAYYADRPDPSISEQRVAFGTSGHRGSSLRRSFNEDHILAMAQAICDYRSQQGTDGPLFLGIDTHALSGPANQTAIEVFAANQVEVMVDAGEGFTPTPVVSHAILTFNAGRSDHRADGVVVSPSHNPPEDGGFKYNPPSGGPADATATSWIQDRANDILADELRPVRRMEYDAARRSPTIHGHDYVSGYVEDLGSVLDLEAVASAGVRIGVDPLGGASIGYWPAIAERYRLDLTVVNKTVDPTFSFMTLDWDGRIRMDCSSPYAMAGLIDLADQFDIAFGNDTDADRHGIVTPKGGLLDPNHYLAVAASFLFAQRTQWPETARVGKTVVSSSMIDRVAGDLGRRLLEVPVGFKWFVDGLLDCSLGFAGEESAGASFLRRNGKPWTTDKDGLIMGLLAAEIIARTGRAPDAHYEDLTGRFGRPVYRRIDAPATPEQKRALARLSPASVVAEELAGDPITEMLTLAPGNGAPIGGLKVVGARGWFAARPSGTEDTYKIYAESFVDDEHLGRIIAEARVIVDRALGAGG